MADSGISVEVALRIRPLIGNEIDRGCQKIVDTVPNEPQIVIRGTDKSFTFNYVFDSDVSQEEFYNKAIRNMVTRLFKGYNVTILAYGQTGSGKTFSMGTSYTSDENMGVIPRAVNDIFETMNNTSENDYRITVSFMELYQETLYDLLANKPREQCVVDIREDTRGIKIPSLTEQVVTSAEEMTKCLIRGSQGRATGATAMNAQSSRSHAIFTICIHQQKRSDENSATCAKFHLVDLAGSERPKKTKAVGERFREGVNINRGLLALGNVISALGDDSQKAGSYICYRDSKLTRLLQDSLGGNSITLMIACISPADYNLDETISTLRYADRARKIKNKPIVNQDPKSAEITRLNNIVRQLQLELLERGGSVMTSDNLQKIRDENENLKQKNRLLTEQLQTALIENTRMFERALIAENAKEQLPHKLEELKEECDETFKALNLTEDQMAICQRIHGKIEDIRQHHKQSEAEMLNHEISSGKKTSDSGDDVDIDANVNFESKQETHMMTQLAYSSQLQELTQALALKEYLASQMAANANDMLDYAQLQENEAKIKALELEKEDLTMQLKSVQTNNASSKIAEQRRKRVQDLEHQISDLNKRVVEQARLIKLKEKDELKIKQLNSEIMTMKQAKVKLVRLMRTEADKYRNWKLAHEKFVSKLKDQDRKRQNQMVRMENMHQKQQTVLKRKVEEAAAINKRLKEALARQKAAQDRRGQNSHGKVERIQQWVGQELDVLVSTLEAERTLEHLIEDRALLAAQREDLCADGEQPSNVDNLKKELDEDLDLRSVQIADLKQKIVDAEQDNKSKNRWEHITTMIDAKCALKQLFDAIANIKRKELSATYKLEDKQEELESLKLKVIDYEDQLKTAEALYKKQMTELERHHEEKISLLLEQLRHTAGGGDATELQAKFCYHEKELEKELQEWKEKYSTLEEKLNNINNVVYSADNKENIEKKKSTERKENSQKTTYNEDAFLSDADTSIDDIDNESNDPDWQKTPIYRRLQRIRRTTTTLQNKDSKQNSSDGDVPDIEENGAVKRTSDGQAKCNCKKGDCGSRVCGCRKLSVSCSSNCKCNADICKNKENTAVGRRLFNLLDEDGELFKKPKVVSAELNTTIVLPANGKYFTDKSSDNSD